MVFLKVIILTCFIFLMNFEIEAFECKEKDTSHFGGHLKLARGDKDKFDCFNPKVLKYKNNDKDINLLIRYFLSYAKNEIRIFKGNYLLERAITQFEMNQMIILIDNYEIDYLELQKIKLILTTEFDNGRDPDIGDLILAVKELTKTFHMMFEIESSYDQSKCWWVFGTDLIEISTRLNGVKGSIFLNENILGAGLPQKHIKEFLESSELFTMFQCGGGELHEINKYLKDSIN